MNNDEHWMRRAIELAALGEGRVEPNPMVGCVLVRDDRLIGSGYHRDFGGPHAEINAIRDCESLGESAAGSTAFVTLEPCCHHGKTPPCADALIRGGVRRVVVAVDDPFPDVDGGGLARLRDAGIEVVTDVAAGESRRLLAPYLKRVRTGRPWVIAKWAMSLDGRIATSTGQSQWITGESARQEVHRLRGRVDAIAVGMGTVIADDPLLTVRPPGLRTPARIVFARRRLPDSKSRLVQTASKTPTWVFAGPTIADRDLTSLADQHVKTIRCHHADAAKMVDEVLAVLGGPDNPTGHPITNLMVEGGGELLGSFADAGQMDEVHVYVGGVLIGGRSAPGPVGDPGFARLDEADRFELIETRTFDRDVRMVYRKV